MKERRTYVVNYVNLVHLNILPIQALVNVFKYYYEVNKRSSDNLSYIHHLPSCYLGVILSKLLVINSTVVHYTSQKKINISFHKVLRIPTLERH